MGKLLTEELALQLTERLLENDKTVNDKLQEKIDNVEKEVPSITATRNEENNGAVITVNSKKITIKDGTDGKDGFSPSVIEDENNTNDIYKLKITTKESVFTTPNLKGKNGDNSSTVGVSQESGNALVEKSDGFYVASVNTSNFVEKEEGKGLFSGRYSDLIGTPTIPSTDGLATETYVDTKIAEAQLDGGDVDLSDYATKDELASTLSDYAKKDDIVKYDDTDIKQSITDLSDRTSVNENAIATLRGTGEGSIKKSVDDALNKFVTDLSDDGVVNTYKELVDYAATHSSDVVEMVAEIEQNTNAIKTLNEKVKDINSEKISQWDAKSEFSGSYNDLKDIPESFPSSDVYNWAKQPTKPTYTASEVGALPADIDIPNIDGLASEDFVNSAIANAQLGGDADLNNYPDCNIKETYHDIYVIPDKYNTGCDNLCTNIINMGDTLECGLEIRPDTGYIDMNKMPQKNMQGDYYIENCDFSSFNTGIYNVSGYTGQGINIHFQNCKFGQFKCNQQNELVKTFFYNCSFTYYSGGYGELNNCYIGGSSSGDASNPSIGTTMKNCYIADICQKSESQGSAHIDGVQILNPIDITFDNCRWECPWLNYSSYYGGLTNAIRLEPQGDMKNVKFNHCVINGGGYYSIHVVETEDGYVEENVHFIESIIGDSCQNSFYSNGTENYFDNIDKASSLFVSSIWKDENGLIHVIVTNDTLVDRQLTIVTNLENKVISVPRNYRISDMEVDTKNFNDLPIDIEYIVDTPNASWVICYEGDRQLRFVNYSKEKVFYSRSVSENESKDENNNENDNNITIPNNYTSDFRWQYVEGEVFPLSLYNWKTKALDSASNQYTSIRYIFNGEKKVRFSGTTSGSTAKLAYVFLDESGNVISSPEFVSGKTYIDMVLDVPAGAYEIRLNGNNYVSPHLEVSVEDVMADMHTLPYLLENFGKRLQYKDKFAWKPMEKGHIAFTFDDSLDDISSTIDLFISKGVPCCFGAIPEKLNMSISSGETVAQAMLRGVNAVNCEVLSHGNNDEIVVESNIDNFAFLYNKFVANKQKFKDFGFNVRGVVRVGGNGNICGDKRTDEWVRLFFDYGDLYGLEEPYNHARASVTATVENFKKVIDDAIENKKFTPILFHQAPEYLEELIDYAIEKGAVICNYAYVYDTYGSTVEKVGFETRLKALESVENGNEVAY